MGKPYSEELQLFAETAEWVATQKVEPLKRYLDRWVGDYAAMIGSGGSYAAAVAIAILRELAHASPTCAATPLQFASISARLPDVRAFLLSAEGKNRDILHVARHSVAADHVVGSLTLTDSSPLTEVARTTRAIRVFSYQMPWVKDGYLATNSLLATVLLFYKTFFGDSAFSRLTESMLTREYIQGRRDFIAATPLPGLKRNPSVLILHGEAARSFAVDMESKVSEAGIAVASAVDLRQFAHGRHLQLNQDRLKPLVMVAYSGAEQRLANETLALFPKDTTVVRVPLMQQEPAALVVEGLVEASYWTERLAEVVSYDVGDPPVGQFGRAVHGLDPEALLAGPAALDYHAVGSIRKNPAARYDPLTMSRLRAAGDAHVRSLERARIKALVCDFDGTLCRAENRFDGIDRAVLKRLVQLAEQGLIVAIASGRGDSLHQNLQEHVPSALQGRILVGLYSGSYIVRLDEAYVIPDSNPEFSALFKWMKGTTYGCPAEPWKKVRGGQFSFSVDSPKEGRRWHAAITNWLRRTGRDRWRAYRSGHSVDVLDSETSKRSVIDAVATAHGLDSMTEVLCLGDCGHEDGNDFELLNHPLSLSVEGVSMELGACWNYARAGCTQAEATLEYLEAMAAHPDGGFQIRFRETFEAIDQDIAEGGGS